MDTSTSDPLYMQAVVSWAATRESVAPAQSTVHTLHSELESGSTLELSRADLVRAGSNQHSRVPCEGGWGSDSHYLETWESDCGDEEHRT